MNLHEQFTAVKAKVQAIYDNAEKENREVTEAEETEANQHFAEMDKLTKKLAVNDRLAKANVDKFTAVKALAAAAIAAAPTVDGKPREKDEFAAHKKAVNNFIFGAPQEDAELFTTISTSGSSVLLPKYPLTPEFVRRSNNVVVRVLASQGLQPIYTPHTAPIPVPVFDDTANTADLIAEDVTGENVKEGTLSGFELGAKLYDSGAWYFSNTLLDAPPYDILATVQPEMEKRLERKMEVDAINVLKAGTVGKTGATANGITYDEFNDWYYSLPQQYRDDAVFIFSNGLLKAVDTLKDDNHRPLMSDPTVAGEPKTLKGRPVFVSDNLADPAANAISGVFVSASAIKMRICTNKRVAKYQNLPDKRDRTGLEIFQNGDVNFVPGGLRSFKQAAA